MSQSVQLHTVDTLDGTELVVAFIDAIAYEPETGQPTRWYAFSLGNTHSIDQDTYEGILTLVDS